MIDRRIYSLNLATYILLTTGISPEVKRDEENSKLYYFVFPTSGIIDSAISVYKQPNCAVNLHQYLNAFQSIRTLIKDKIGGD